MSTANPAPIGTEDAGAQHWTRLLSGEGGAVLDFQSGEQGDIVAVTRLGLFRSVDRGDQWTRIGAPPLIQTLHRSKDWWLGTDFGLFRTDRLDGTWEPLLSRTAVSDVFVSEQSGLVLVASTEEGLLRSEDRGSTWEDANPGLPGDTLIAIHQSPRFAQDQMIFVATESGLFRSRTGGRAWRRVPLETEDIQCFVTFEHQLLIGTGEGGLWSSPDAGRTWRQSHAGEAIIGFGTSTTGSILVLTDTRCLTVDASINDLRDSPLPPDALCAMTIDSRTLVGTLSRGALRLTSDGRGWAPSSAGLEASARDRVRAVGGSRIVTTSAAGSILHSADRGESWHELPDAPVGPVTDFAARMDTDTGLEIVACDRHGAHLYRGGWRLINAASPLAVAWFNGEPAVITNEGNFVCNEIRSSMFPWRPRLIGAQLLPVCGLPNVLWSVLYTENAGVIVLRSPDGGKRWEPLLQSNAADAVSLTVTIDTSGNEIALAAAGNRIYRVLESPAPVWTGADGTAISALAISPNGNVLIATNRGLIAASPDLAMSKPIAGSPAPLLDVEVGETEEAVVVEHGGSVWRFGEIASIQFT